MPQLRMIGAGIAVAGSILGVARYTQGRRRVTAATIMKMDEQAFEKRMRATGMEAQVRSALARVDRGTA